MLLDFVASKAASVNKSGMNEDGKKGEIQAP